IGRVPGTAEPSHCRRPRGNRRAALPHPHRQPRGDPAVNHKHQSTEYYAGGRVPVPPRAQWWRGDKPADPTPAQRPAMPSPEITRLLAELETVVATAEEIRYRIRVALGRPEPAQPNQPAAVPSAPQAPPRESPPPASK